MKSTLHIFISPESTIHSIQETGNKRLDVKTLCLICLLLIITINVKSQTTSNVIPTDSAANEFDSFIQPVDDFWEYGWNEQLITKDEIVKAGGIPGCGLPVTISQIYLEEASATNSWTMGNQRIYMKNVPDTTFTSSFYPGNGSFQQVFGGSIYLPSTATKIWIPITFTSNFIWDGVSNIDILYENHEGNWLNGPTKFVEFSNYYPAGVYRTKLDYNSNPTVFVSCNSCNRFRSAVPIKFEYSSTTTPISFSMQPTDSPSMCSPASTSFTASATGGTNISYHWQVNNGSWSNLTDGGSNPKYMGSTDTILHIDSASISLQYRCLASNCTGSNITSNSATLTISTPVNITAISNSKIKCSGDTATFTITSNGSQLSYQWFKLESGNWKLEAGDTQPSLVFNSVAVLDSGNYKCVVSNACNKDSVITSLKINQAPIFQDTIANTSKCEGDSIRFQFTATGDNLSYQWTKGGTNIAGASNSTYTIGNIQPTDYNFYSCKVTNECGSVSLPNFTLTVNSPPTSNIIYVTQTKSAGDSVSYTLSPGGSGPFIFQWKKRGVKIAGATSSTYSIIPIDCPDSGIYTCEITNSCDSILAKVVHLYVINCSRTKFAIFGNVKYENTDSSAMSSETANTITTVYLKNSGDVVIDSINTDNTGYYIFVELPNATYNISCKTNKAWGGVNPIDALIVNRTYIGLYNLTGNLKRLAADVNNDGKINPIDALLINRRYIDLVHKFTIPDWLFDEPTVEIAGENVTQNINAICAGDVNGSYVPPLRVVSNQLSVISNKTINIDLNKPFDIPIYLNDYTELGALGLKIKVQNYPNPNPSPNGEGSTLLKTLDVKSDIEGLIYNLTDDGVDIAWAANNAGYTVTPDKPLLVLSAECNSSTDCRLQIADFRLQIRSESVLADVECNQISTDKLEVPKIVLSSQSSVFSLSCFPNPFNEQTVLSYQLSDNCQVLLKVYDIYWKEVATLADEIMLSGKHETVFNADNLSAGIYYYRLNAGGNTITGKIIRIKN